MITRETVLSALVALQFLRLVLRVEDDGVRPLWASALASVVAVASQSCYGARTR
jgi:hypothetical protein